MSLQELRALLHKLFQQLRLIIGVRGLLRLPRHHLAQLLDFGAQGIRYRFLGGLLRRSGRPLFGSRLCRSFFRRSLLVRPIRCPRRRHSHEGR